MAVPNIFQPKTIISSTDVNENFSYLDGNITAETARAEGEEATLSAAIASETSRAEAAEDALSGSLAAKAAVDLSNLDTAGDAVIDGRADARVQAARGTTNPLVNGTASPGSSTNWASEDHVHPVDPTKLTILSTLSAAQSYSQTDYPIYIRGRTTAGDGYEGTFEWASGDQSANVSNDPAHGIWLPPTSDPTGASGAWKRQFTGYIDLLWFGAAGDGTTDDTQALQSWLNAPGVNGATLLASTGVFAVSSVLQVYDGTSTSRSTKTGVCIVGIANGGVGGGEFGAPKQGTTIKWIGSSAPTSPIMRVSGPGHSFSIENVGFDCNSGLCGTGIEGINLYQCQFRKVHVDGWSYRAFHFHCWNAALPSGVTQGLMENHFELCTARTPSSSSAETGFYFNGDVTNNVGCSRNTAIGCYSLIGGDAGTRAIYLGFADNNTFIEFGTNWGTATHSGVGVYFDQPASQTAFPHENTFVNCPIVGGIGGVSGTGGNVFAGYPTSDSEPVPAIANVRGWTYDGIFFGKWAGTASAWSGKCDPGPGVGTTSLYFCVSGISTGQASVGNNALTLPAGAVVSEFRTLLENAPGTGNTRIATLLKNGSGTTLSTFYNSGENGDKASNGAVTYAGGDTLEVFWDVTGTPTNGQASWSIVFYLQEAP